jgi:hypothetical protein
LGLTIKRIRSYFILPLLHQLKDDGGVTNSDNNDLFGMLFSHDHVDSTPNNSTGNTPSFDGRLTAVK